MSSNKWLRLAPLMRSGLRCRPMSAPNGQQVVRFYWPSRRTYLWDPFVDMERSMSRVWRDWDRMSPFGLLRHRMFDPFTETVGFRVLPETVEDGQKVFRAALDLSREFRPEDINVTVKDREVTVKARRESDTNGCKQLHEYSYQYSLPDDVNIDKIKSLLTSDGQLTIEAPLLAIKEAEPAVTEIPVQRKA